MHTVPTVRGGPLDERSRRSMRGNEAGEAGDSNKSVEDGGGEVHCEVLSGIKRERRVSGHLAE